MAPDQYGPSFQHWLDGGAKRSAEIVVPIVAELCRPDSVVDIGCGNGAWLAEFGRLGVKTLLGVDGDYVDRGSLRVDPHQFVAHDLSTPFACDRRFDLALSLEVAEHLAGDFADVFVKQLTELAPVVLFSAALPFQGGVGHVNEQWPGYWAERFAGLGYLPADCVRPRIWADPDVDFWYAQNALLYVDAERAEADPVLGAAVAATDPRALGRVHPAQYLAKVEAGRLSGRQLVRSATATLRRVVQERAPGVVAAASRRRPPPR